MTKLRIISTIVLLSCTLAAKADTLSWAAPAPYPSKSACQPVKFDQPDAIAVNKLGDVYIANEAGPDAVQEVTADGKIRTLVSRRAEPVQSGHYFGLSLAVGSEGSLYVAVRERGTVEKLETNGVLSVVAGKPGDRRLQDGKASDARLRAPNAIAIDHAGIIYISDAKTIRKIRPDGTVSTLAGNPHARLSHPTEGGMPYYRDGRGAHATFMGPAGIAVDESDNVYVADSYAGELEGQSDFLGVIRKISSNGAVSTVAGRLGMGDNFDGKGADADFEYIFGIARDAEGNLYVTEPYGSSRIRKVDTSANVTTVVVPTINNYMSTDINTLTGIAIGEAHTLFAVDDLAFLGFPNLTARHMYWLHRIVGHAVSTLCMQTGPSQ